MKVLLINPPTPDTIANKDYYIPSGLLYLGAALQKADIEVNLLDLDIFRPWEKKPVSLTDICDPIVIDRIKSFLPDIVGIACKFSGHITLVLHFAELIKAQFHEIQIMLGGVHPTLFSKEILENCAYVDWIILAEGDFSFVQFVKTLQDRTYRFDQIDGFAYRSGDDVIVNPKTSYITDLDLVPFPAYNLINLKDYYLDTSHWQNPKILPIHCTVPIITSRGCPMNCNYCSAQSASGRRWRARTAQNVVDQIEYVYNTFEQRHFSFIDDQSTLSKPRILEISNEIIKRNLNLEFETQNGVMLTTLDREVVDAMVLAGWVRMVMPIESGSDYIRNHVMRKRLPREKLFEVRKLLGEYSQLYVKAFFIIGMPEDTRETLMDTYNMIKEIDVDWPQVFNLMPYQGTEVFDQAVRDHLFVGDFDLNNNWRFDGYYGTGHKQFFIKPYQMTIEELEEFRIQFDELIDGLLAKKSNNKFN